MAEPNDKCLNDKEKKVLSDLVDEKIHNSALSADELSELTEMRENVIACVQSPETPKAGVKKKRKPSKYNIFIGNCMRGGGSDMKSCATEYKEKKQAGEI